MNSLKKVALSLGARFWLHLYHKTRSVLAQQPFRPLVILWGLARYFREFSSYRKLEGEQASPWHWKNFNPYIDGYTSHTAVDPVYFYQDTWAAGLIFKNRPQKHVDVGSHHKTVGLLSQFTPTTMIDIRPLPISLPGLKFVQGDICRLPLKSRSVRSLSSLCVVEHIGLGRYGDALDPQGSVKAARELARVLAPGGRLYVSLPVEGETRVYFNSHRAFSRGDVLKLFGGLKLEEERYQYGYRLERKFRPNGEGTGLYLFRRP